MKTPREQTPREPANSSQPATLINPNHAPIEKTLKCPDEKPPVIPAAVPTKAVMLSEVMGVQRPARNRNTSNILPFLTRKASDFGAQILEKPRHGFFRYALTPPSAPAPT